jgi:hypothetical protein
MKSPLQIYKIGLASLGFAFTSLFVALGIEQVINPPKRIIGMAGMELLIIFGPIWVYLLGWLTWAISDARLLGSVYPKRAKQAVACIFLGLLGAAVIVAMVS